MKISFFIPFLGKPKNDMVLYTLRAFNNNKNILLYLIVDEPDHWKKLLSKIEYNENINIVKISRDLLIDKSKKLFDVELDNLSNRDIICGLKPFYKILFDDIVFIDSIWGWSDYDIVLPNNLDLDVIKNFENKDVINISAIEHSAKLQFFRNDSKYDEYIKNIRINNCHPLCNFLQEHKTIAWYDEKHGTEKCPGSIKYKRDYMKLNNVTYIPLQKLGYLFIGRSYDSKFEEFYINNERYPIPIKCTKENITICIDEIKDNDVKNKLINLNYKGIILDLDKIIKYTTCNYSENILFYMNYFSEKWKDLDGVLSTCLVRAHSTIPKEKSYLGFKYL